MAVSAGGGKGRRLFPITILGHDPSMAGAFHGELNAQIGYQKGCF